MDAAGNKQEYLRLRVFAGPNGSGKSTVIREIRNTVINERPIDFGHYINADDIAKKLREDGLDIAVYELPIDNNGFCAFAESSGLLNDNFSLSDLKSSYTIEENTIHSLNSDRVEQLAQLLARYLREQMLESKKRFSFETVFSHESNLDIMKRAKEMGYKVYLYFISTESPEINKYRVRFRVSKGGHNVPTDKIESRYHRSLSLLYEAAQLAYQAYFFDNSLHDSPFRLVAHFKLIDGKQIWDDQEETLPKWFEKHYHQS